MPTKLLTFIPKTVFTIWITFFLISPPSHAAIQHPAHLPSTTPGQTLTLQTDPLAFILLAKPHAGQLAHLKTTVESKRGRVVHTFPQQAIIVNLTNGPAAGLASLPGVALVTTEVIDPASVDIYGPQARQYANVWNSLIQPPPSAASLAAAQHPPEPHQDALIAPDVPAANPFSATATEITPGYYQTSEYMAGSVAVGIVLLESNGQTDPSSENWSADEIQQVFSEIVAALNWWATLEPRANLSFVYDDHFSRPLPTAVEPITRPYYDQRYWIADALGTLGYTASSYFTCVRDYNNDLRRTYQTDWAFTIFVVDSSADSDNRFSDGFFAYAYLGGPFMVMTSGNNGYGLANMDAVAAHEIGHIFNALDQYYTAYQPCTHKGGYLGVENQNSQYGSCSSNVASIMRGQISPFQARAIDLYAAGQIGWRDSDGDNILDPLDTALPVTIDTSTQNENTVSIRGSAQVVPYPSPSRASVTINTLTTVQYRLNNGHWQFATPTDGAFDSTTETYQVDVSLPPGLYQLEIAATDSAGNVSNPPAAQTIVVSDRQGGLTTQVYPPAPPLITGQLISLDGVAYHLSDGLIAGVQYRVDEGPWQAAIAHDGAFDSNYEAFRLTLPSLEPGSYSLEVFATDDEGNSETQGVHLILQISEAQHTQIFLPLIVR